MTQFKHEERWPLANELLEIAKADTPFADLYLKRARELISAELTEAQYAVLASFDDEAASLTSRIEAAMAECDWARVRELSERAGELKRAVSEQAPVRATAARVYGFDTILVDPFSPGICGLAGAAEYELPALRDGAVKRLDVMRAADPAGAELYEARRGALSALQLAASPATADDDAVTVETLQARAHAALAQGDLAQVKRLSAQLLEQEASTASGSGGGGVRASLTPPALTRPFPRAVCDRAAGFGLVAHRAESMAEDAVARFHPSWRPMLGDPSGNTLRLALTVPGDTDEALRDAAMMFMNRAFVTSAGTRYIPWMVAEDLLVEEFAPSSATAAPASPLLAALELPRRAALPRRTIEKALRLRGADVVKELGLDPREYRLTCLPADVHTRLGAKLGWEKQEMWTHFDGYMVSKERKLMALVGGDARFGGLHDFVAVGADYDSDQLYARFAVVQRRRFATW